MRLGFGCVNLASASGGRSPGADVGLVHEAIARGVTVFDTADVYGSGASERLLGRALRGRRDDVAIATKGGYTFRRRSAVEQSARRVAVPLVRLLGRERDGGGMGAGGTYSTQDFSPSYLRAAVESSLRRLRTDRIDVYQLHGPPEPMPDLIAELHDLVSAGKVLRFGVGAESTTAGAAWTRIDGVETVQVPFGVLDPDASTDVFPEARRRSVEVWARGVLGGGVLRAAQCDPSAIKDHPKASLIAELGDLAVRSGLGTDQIAFGFVRSFCGDISTVLVGISSRQHLVRNVELMDAPPMPDDVLAELAGIVARRPDRGTGAGV